MCYSYHHGQTLAGHTFDKVCKDYKKTWVGPYAKFVQSVYGKSCHQMIHDTVLTTI